MAEDRMLSDEILLGLINKNSGGGTTNYNQLKNKPQIGGVTLQGNKTASDLGLATETALADKADKSAVKNEFIGTLEEWNVLTAEQRKAYDTYQFTNDFMEGRYIYLPTIYSEEERQVGVWIDGKPLYQKTVKYSGNYSGDGDLTLNIQNIDQMVDIKAMGYDGDSVWMMLSQAHTNASFNRGFFYNKTTNNMVYRFGSVITLIIATLQYTKTTDQPGSGTWTPEGQLAHHYSTSEKIVGTWIDGSTVYERTWDFSASPKTVAYNSWTSLGINIPNGKVLLSSEISSGADGIEFELRVNDNYSVYAEYNQNTNIRKIKYLTFRYTKSS